MSKIFADSLLSASHLPFLELLIYCAIISAVDPVAVIAVFQELNVNMSLYIVEFGESLLNDGVSLLGYETLELLKKSRKFFKNFGTKF